MLQSLARVGSSLSVRSRIIAIAVIPVLGFLVNGIAFTSGERAVDGAFQSAQQAAALADASREFKNALAALRITAKDFAAQPTEALVQVFEASLAQATRQLEVIDGVAGEAERTSIEAFRRKLSEIGRSFLLLKQEQERVGFTEDEGLRRALSGGGIAVERIISSDMSWLVPADRDKLLVSLLTMRRYEAEFRLNRMQSIRSQFEQEYRKLNQILADIIAPDIMKEDLGRGVKSYADAFGAWTKSAETVHRLLAGLGTDSELLLPEADKMIAAARRRAGAAAQQLSASQAHTRTILILIGSLAVLIGLAFSWWIGRSITRPLDGLAAAMARLAAGDTNARIPATEAEDQIGAMARTVLVFRDSMIERERLADTQLRASRAREQRGEQVAAMIGRFEDSVEQALSKLRAAAHRLETTSTMLNGAADAVSSEAGDAEQRAGNASANVAAAASAVDELAASIGEIAARASKSTEVAGCAVAETRRTVQTMTELGGAASRIGEVLGLIQAIAAQTNLLALNATIEAARAGDAGRGFAVVAAEVKSLASQTAQATQDIAGQIGAIQSAASEATAGIGQVSTVIENMSAIAATVANTVEEQNRAVSSIADGINRASQEARSGAEAMARVADASTDARGTAADVKALADALASQAESLDGEVRRFLAEVRAA